MILLPNRNRILSFLLMTLGPAIALPLMTLLFASLGGFGGLAFLTIYVFPALLIAHAIGITNTSSSVYSSVLFEGYIGIGPTPIGFVFCTVVWVLFGYLGLFAFIGFWSPCLISPQSQKEPKKWNPDY